MIKMLKCFLLKTISNVLFYLCTHKKRFFMILFHFVFYFLLLPIANYFGYIYNYLCKVTVYYLSKTLDHVNIRYFFYKHYFLAIFQYMFHNNCQVGTCLDFLSWFNYLNLTMVLIYTIYKSFKFRIRPAY